MASGASIVQGFSLYDISRGVAGSKLASWSKSGYAISTGTTQFSIWIPSSEYVWPVLNQQMEVLSTDNVNDKAGGTGALTVYINYLTSAYVEKITTVILNGTTAVDTTAVDIFRINNFRLATTGATGKAAGTISVRNRTDHTTVYGQIAAGFTRARSSIYTVPTGKVLYISSITLSSGSTAGDKTMRMTLHATYDCASGGAVLTPGVFFMPYTEIESMDDAYTKLLEVPVNLPAGVDLKVSGIGESGTTCASLVRGWLETL